MKNRLYLYLFLFAALFAIYFFTTVYNMQKALSEDVSILTDKVEALEDSLRKAELRVLDLQYFSLDNNDDALAYYEEYNLENPSRYIADKLLETNERQGDNPLVPYAGMNGSFKINKIKVLNHKWILADFSDGKYWGDLIIKYELKEDLGVDFTLLDHLLYGRSN